jgi:hypothetical protein
MNNLTIHSPTGSSQNDMPICHSQSHAGKYLEAGQLSGRSPWDCGLSANANKVSLLTKMMIQKLKICGKLIRAAAAAAGGGDDPGEWRLDVMTSLASPCNRGVYDPHPPPIGGQLGDPAPPLKPPILRRGAPACALPPGR